MVSGRPKNSRFRRHHQPELFFLHNKARRLSMGTSSPFFSSWLSSLWAIPRELLLWPKRRRYESNISCSSET